MAMHAHEPPEPLDQVFTLRDALRFVRRNPARVCVNLADGQPSMPGPWVRRMRLRGAWLYVHSGNERAALAYLASLPPLEDDELS
jgi:hypothetical protein